MRLAFLPEMDAFLCPPLSHILIFFVILTLKTIISNNSRGKKVKYFHMKSWLNLYGFLFSKNWYVMKHSTAGWLVGTETPMSSDLSTSNKGRCPVTRHAVPGVLKCPFPGRLDHRMQPLNRVSSHLVRSFLLSHTVLPCPFLQGQAESMGSVVVDSGQVMFYQDSFTWNWGEKAWLGSVGR